MWLGGGEGTPLGFLYRREDPGSGPTQRLVKLQASRSALADKG